MLNVAARCRSVLLVALPGDLQEDYAAIRDNYLRSGEVGGRWFTHRNSLISCGTSRIKRPGRVARGRRRRRRDGCMGLLSGSSACSALKCSPPPSLSPPPSRFFLDFQFPHYNMKTPLCTRRASRHAEHTHPPCMGIQIRVLRFTVATDNNRQCGFSRGQNNQPQTNPLFLRGLKLEISPQ